MTQCTALLYRLRSLRRAVRAAGPPWRACRRGIGLLASLGDRVDVPHLSESRGRSVSQGVRRASDVLSNTCTPLLCATRVQPILHTASLFHAREQAPARDQRGVDGPDAAGGAQLDNGARGGGRCGGHVRGFLVRPGRCGTERVGQAAPSPPPTASDARPTPDTAGLGGVGSTSQNLRSLDDDASGALRLVFRACFALCTSHAARSVACSSREALFKLN